MAANAICLHPLRSVFAYSDCLIERSKSKRRRVIKAVAGFGYIFADPASWQMTIYALGGFSMSAVLPCRVRYVHHMAVYTGFWIGAEIVESFGSAKKIRKQPYRNDQSAKSDCRNRSFSPHIPSSCMTALYYVFCALWNNARYQLRLDVF
jgi:hypothetical protein